MPAKPRLSKQQREFLDAVRAGRVTFGDRFPGRTERTGTPGLNVTMLDGHEVYGQQHATALALDERGLTITLDVPYNPAPVVAAPEDEQLGDYEPTYRHPPLDLGARVRNYGEQYTAAHARGTGNVVRRFVHNGHLEYVVRRDDGTLTEWSDECTEPVELPRPQLRLGTVEEAAETLGITPDAVRALLDARELLAFGQNITDSTLIVWRRAKPLPPAPPLAQPQEA